MKKFRKLVAATMAASMIMAMGVAANAADADTTISVTGLKAGDKVSAQQILVEDQTAEKGWKVVDALNGVITADDILDGVDQTEYGAIVAALGTGTQTAITGTTWSMSENVNPGTYVIVVTPADAGIVYNPIVVSADYEPDNGTNTVDAKSTPITVDKTVASEDPMQDIAAGTEVPFKVETTMPAYPSNYTAPKFDIEDTLTGDITLKTGTVAVEVAGVDMTKDTDYTITEKANGAGYTVSFTAAGIQKVAATPVAKKVTVTYTGVVADATAFTANVTKMNNKVVVTYSHNPSDSSDYKTIDDETNHYTFTIDGLIDGTTALTPDKQLVNKELIKRAVDKDGNPILETVREYTTSTTGETTTEASPLAGATFKLTGAKGFEATYTTVDNGFIVFQGLDAGTYTLEEVSAPTGYVKDTTAHTVVISATYSDDENPVLVSYKVTVDGKDSVFNVTNEGPAEVKTTIGEGETTILTSLISNVKANGLPATGGMGTTVFYIAGLILVLGAGIVLVARRRMDK